MPMCGACPRCVHGRTGWNEPPAVVIPSSIHPSIHPPPLQPPTASLPFPAFPVAIPPHLSYTQKVKNRTGRPSRLDKQTGKSVWSAQVRARASPGLRVRCGVLIPVSMRLTRDRAADLHPSHAMQVTCPTYTCCLSTPDVRPGAAASVGVDTYLRRYRRSA